MVQTQFFFIKGALIILFLNQYSGIIGTEQNSTILTLQWIKQPIPIEVCTVQIERLMLNQDKNLSSEIEYHTIVFVQAQYDWHWLMQNISHAMSTYIQNLWMMHAELNDFLNLSHRQKDMVVPTKLNCKKFLNVIKWVENSS